MLLGCSCCCRIQPLTREFIQFNYHHDERGACAYFYVETSPINCTIVWCIVRITATVPHVSGTEAGILNELKLDGKALLITDPPPLSSTALSQQKNVTCDTWHVTCDTWHVTCDMWHVVGVNNLSKFQLPSSYGLGWKVIWRSGGKGWVT